MRKPVFILPGHLSRSASIDARWLVAADLSAALGGPFDGIEILTPYGPMTPGEVREKALRVASAQSAARTAAHGMPRYFRPLLGDLRAMRRNLTLKRAALRVRDHAYPAIFQMHYRFQGAGHFLARRTGVPFILRVDALEIQEERAWGTSRPGYGRLIEFVSETRLLRMADLVVPVSASIDERLGHMGIREDRRFVMPNGVDTQRFRPGAPDADLRQTNGLEGQFVVGWVGGFRPFHGLDQIPELAERLRRVEVGGVRVHLCLLGTGPLRDEIARQVKQHGDVITILPPARPDEVAKWIRTFDACLLLASPGEFHYSPLKLFEYMACARPVIAPRIGEIEKIVRHGHDGLLVNPGDSLAIVDAVARLARSPALRHRLGAEARRAAESASWEARVGSLLSAAQDRGLVRGKEKHRVR